MNRTRRRTAAVAACAAVVLAGCASHPDPPAATRPASSATSTPATASSAPASSTPAPSTPASTSGHSSPASSSAPASSPASRELPRGGTQVLGHFRVVADYGAPGGGALGTLGVGTPEQAAERISDQAKGFEPYGPVQPAMELIATVARSSPGPDGTYSAPIPTSDVQRYLAAAHAHKMLLVLDLQPGRASFLEQAKRLRPFLLDPSVGIGLDSEWKVGPGQQPGNGLIGSSSAADVNAVGSWLSDLVTENHLPDKLMVVHQFTPPMLRNRSQIRTNPGVEVVFHADGFGTPTVKRNVYHQLAFPHRPFGCGFKLFLTQDSRLMSPHEVMALSPRPDVITYQ